MVHPIRAYINKHRLLPEDKPVLVGLSGGADSVALLNILVRLGYTCIACHCNFHLRGEEADRDERFAEDVARKLDVPFYRTDFDTNRYAGERHISTEMAARELRYQWFEEMRIQTGSQAIAVAHHRDDHVETLLMNLVRGTGIRGIRGIRPRNGYVVRPLLAVNRDDILKWLEEEHLSSVTDSTNRSDVYTRNFIRLRVLPLLEEINPSVREALARSSEHFSEVEAIYHFVIEKAKESVITNDHRLSITELMKLPSPETILYELLTPYHVTPIIAKEIFSALSKEPGKIFYSPTHRIVKDRDSLLISPVFQEDHPVYTLDTEEGTWHVPIELSCKKMGISNGFPVEKDKHTACFDYDKLTFPLTLRTWQAGDWFVPFGMKGRKKLSDYFSDHKYSRIDKEKTWLLCSGEQVIWIVGERADNRFRIEKTTENILIAKFSCKTEQEI
jgi:tRNA(Ile)-lysidine synthase